ncbi:hypothetical protein CAPTEDRAFT_212401 [Capitella teleta]|uniref:Uncharacterized protein n=1 Tax=Capitella teleta TaxID=283909 RepID=R7TX61_CAPTE|nr:hypothetical protein CAPTEDRAFT_212401 [Capitella teleta]|eukprot:ELT98192.1 hypothetical protein CAPTEDRAFT_212401 [Capitella teleta]
MDIIRSLDRTRVSTMTWRRCCKQGKSIMNVLRYSAVGYQLTTISTLTACSTCDNAINRSICNPPNRRAIDSRIIRKPGAWIEGFFWILSRGIAPDKCIAVEQPSRAEGFDDQRSQTSIEEYYKDEVNENDCVTSTGISLPTIEKNVLSKSADAKPKIMTNIALPTLHKKAPVIFAPKDTQSQKTPDRQSGDQLCKEAIICCITHKVCDWNSEDSYAEGFTGKSIEE